MVRHIPTPRPNGNHHRCHVLLRPPVPMPLVDIYHVLRDSSRRQQSHQEKLRDRLLDVFHRTWDLGFTAFGGPNVHFQIFFRRFVDTSGAKTPWIDEQTVSQRVFRYHRFSMPSTTKHSPSSTRSYSQYVRAFRAQAAPKCSSASYSFTPASYPHCSFS